jgi:hypothetical protein
MTKEWPRNDQGITKEWPRNYQGMTKELPRNDEGMTTTIKFEAQNKAANTDTSGTSIIHWTAVLAMHVTRTAENARDTHCRRCTWRALQKMHVTRTAEDAATYKLLVREPDRQNIRLTYA